MIYLVASGDLLVGNLGTGSPIGDSPPVLLALGADVVLVSHSWGGYPATGAAHRLADRVAKVIYFSAVVPEQPAGELMQNVAALACVAAHVVTLRRDCTQAVDGQALPSSAATQS